MKCRSCGNETDCETVQLKQSLSVLGELWNKYLEINPMVQEQDIKFRRAHCHVFLESIDSSENGNTQIVDYLVGPVKIAA